MKHDLYKRPILFFDGPCGLCQNSVKFLLKHMKKNTLYFSPLTGQTAKDLNLAGQMPLGYSYGETVVFYAKTQIYIKSEALIEALKYMKAPYCYLGFLLKIFPQKIRDFFYFQIARRRNMFFSNNMCFIPRQSEKKHFLP